MLHMLPCRSAQQHAQTLGSKLEQRQPEGTSNGTLLDTGDKPEGLSTRARMRMDRAAHKLGLSSSDRPPE